MTSRMDPGWRLSSSRRQVLNLMGLSVVPLLAGKWLSLAYTADGDEDPWRAAEAILQRTRPPEFPDHLSTWLRNGPCQPDWTGQDLRLLILGTEGKLGGGCHAL
jgi:hypothetical protein